MVDFRGHVERVVEELLHELRLKALIVMGSSNILYLVATDAPSAAMIHEEGSAITLSSRLEYTRALDEARLGTHYAFTKSEDVCEYESVVRGDLYEALKELAGRVEGSVGYVAPSQDVRNKLAEVLGQRCVDASEKFKSLRRRKDASEVEAVKRAIEVAERAMERALSSLERGVTEVEVAAEIVSLILRSGAQPAFPPIVAFGEHAAHPHANPSLRKLRDNDFVKVDLGARVEGYCSDLTCTIIFGGENGEKGRLLKAVVKAQEEAVKLLKAGAEAKEVHTRAYEVLKDFGLSKYFVHGLGHGIGVDVHEDPYLSAESAARLAEGDVVTVEPGVYVRGLGGVRVEDVFLITGDGCEQLTSFPRVLSVTR